MGVRMPMPSGPTIEQGEGGEAVKDEWCRDVESTSDKGLRVALSGQIDRVEWSKHLQARTQIQPFHSNARVLDDVCCCYIRFRDASNLHYKR